MDEFESRFVEALSHPEVAKGIKQIIEPLLNQHLDTLTNIMQDLINPLKSGLKKRKRKDITQRKATDVHLPGERQGPEWCFGEVKVIFLDILGQKWHG